eukprot:1003302-Pyramimonas_sp.AAC.1
MSIGATRRCDSLSSRREPAEDCGFTPSGSATGEPLSRLGDPAPLPSSQTRRLNKSQPATNAQLKTEKHRRLHRALAHRAVCSHSEKEYWAASVPVLP